MKRKKKGLKFWFTLLFVSFAAIILIVTGFATYIIQMDNYKLECEKNIRGIGEYLAELMKTDGDDIGKYQEYFMNNYRNMKIDFNFTECESARLDFISEFSKRYPGKALGMDVPIEDTTPEIQRAYFTYKHEFWLLAFEKAREIFNIPYTYYLVMGDKRARTESLKDQSDNAHNVCYMIDGERTLDEEKSQKNGEKYLYLGDTYLNQREKYGIMWDTWDTGVKQEGYMEWDNDWGHTYGYYTPLIINGKKLGLVASEIDVKTVNKDILINTLKQVAIIALIFGFGFFVMLMIIRRRVISRTTKLEEAMLSYSVTKDEAIAESVEEVFSGGDEIDSLGKGFASMVREVAEHMQKMINANRQLEVSRKREYEMSELAIKDALTGIRNKTAYDREVFKINKDINEGNKKFGVAMVDMNDLKKINDKWGHEKGDIAIQKLCRLVCVVFDHSPVFRIGGDEFVVILKNSDYDSVDKLIDEFYVRIKAMEEDETREWEKPSAAIGYALYDEELDNGMYDSVFRRADQNMYDKKQEMK